MGSPSSLAPVKGQRVTELAETIDRHQIGRSDAAVLDLDARCRVSLGLSRMGRPRPKERIARDQQEPTGCILRNTRT